MTDLAAHAQSIIDANRYLTLGTVDADGHPWTSPVYFAPDGLRAFYWLSNADAAHSVNLSRHPRVSVAIFDSTVPPYHGRAVYAVGEAQALSGDGLDHGLAIYPGSPDRGGRRIARDEVTGSSPWRLYHAAVSDLWVLCPAERPGEPCTLHGLSKDHRTRVEW